MKKCLLLFLLSWSGLSIAAIGDKLQGNWSGSGTIDEFVPAFSGNRSRQGIQSCRNVTVALTTTSNRLRIDLRYQCGGGLPSGSSNFDYQLRDVGGKPYREVFDPNGSPSALGRIFVDRLDLMELLVDPGVGDLMAVYAELTSTKALKFRLSWSGVGNPIDSFGKYLLVSLTKK